MPTSKKRPARKSPPARSPQGGEMSAKEFDAAVDAGIQATAGRTPPLVREALLAGPLKVGAIELRPFSLGHLLLLEEIEHPFIADGDDQREMAIRDVTVALFIFAEPEAAKAAHDGGRLADAAFQFALGVPAEDLPAIGGSLRAIIQRGMQTIPGYDADGSPAGGGDEADPLGKSRPARAGSAGA